MQLNLKNPIIFLDLETTGIDIVKDRIVELSLVKVMPDGTKEVKTRRINPGMPIPEAATAIHGITDDDVKDCPRFEQVAKSLAAYIKGSDLGGYNSNRFDIPMLAEEFLRAGVDIDLKKRKFVDVQTIFHKKEQRTLSAAYKFYCDSDLEGAHSAEADTLATYEVLQAQLDRYDDLRNDIDFLEYTDQKPRRRLCGTYLLDDHDKRSLVSANVRGQSVRRLFRRNPPTTNG